MRPLTRCRIHVHARDLRTRKAFSQQSLHLLRAESTLAHERPTAAFAAIARRLRVLTVVADEALGRAVVRQADRAVGAARNVAAGTALYERRVAAPIEQQNALLPFAHAVGQRTLERLAEHPAKGVDRAAALRQLLLLAKVDDVDLRKTSATDALGQCEQPELSAASVHPALEARRGAAQHDEGVLCLRANDRDLTSMISRRLSLFVASFVLLVDDDGAEVRERREDRGACAHGDALLAALERQPRVVS